LYTTSGNPIPWRVPGLRPCKQHNQRVCVRSAIVVGTATGAAHLMAANTPRVVLLTMRSRADFTLKPQSGRQELAESLIANCCTHSLPLDYQRRGEAVDSRVTSSG
jgi:hypothetical protein